MAGTFVQSAESSSAAGAGVNNLKAILGGAGFASASQTVATPGVFTTAVQAFVAGQAVYLSGTAPGGFSLGVPYFVIAGGLSTTSCELSLTSGGAGIQCTASAACTINPTIITTAGNLLIAHIHADIPHVGTITDTLSNGPFTIVGHADNTANQGDWIYVCQNILGGATVLNAAWSSVNMSAFSVEEWSGLGTSGAVIGSSFTTQNGTSSGANTVTTGLIPTPKLPAILWSLCQDNTGSHVPTVGTSPVAFSDGGSRYGNYTGGVRARSENARITLNGSYAGTFGNVGFNGDNFDTCAILLAEAGAISTGAGGTGTGGPAGGKWSWMKRR